MALIIGGAQYSGKVGNKVYAKTGWVRQYAVPGNPNTTPQAAIRAMIATYSTQFRSFSPANQEAWQNAAENFPRYNRIGEKYELSGMNLYNSCAMIAQIVENVYTAMELPTETTPPSPQTASVVALTHTDVAGAEIKVFTNANINTTEYLIFFATPPLSTGINFTRRSRYRLVHISDDTEANHLETDIGADYIAVFGTSPPPGTRIFVEGYIVRSGEWIKRPIGKTSTVVT